jgi:hypothetical protein
LHDARVNALLKGTSVGPAKTLEVEDAEKKKKTIDNPDYIDWIARDQHVMIYLFKYMSLLPWMCSLVSLDLKPVLMSRPL